MTRLECKVCLYPLWSTSLIYWNMTRLECKVANRKEYEMAIKNWNMTRLECKVKIQNRRKVYT